MANPCVLYTGQLRTQKLNELASSLQKQQAVFSKCRDTHEGLFYCYTYCNKLIVELCYVTFDCYVVVMTYVQLSTLC